MVKLAIKRPKKNLLKPLNNWTISWGHTIISDYELKCTGGSGWLKSWIPVSVSVGSTYTLSIKGNLLIYIRNGVGVSTSTIMGGSSRSYTFTATTDTVTISIECDTSTDVGKSGYDVQLEQSSSVTNFETYNVVNKFATLRPSSTTLTSDFTGKVGNGYTTDFSGKIIYNITSNFTGKVSGSTVENPNKSFRNSNTSLGVPSFFTTELLSDNGSLSYQKIYDLDGTLFTQTNSSNGNISQQLFSFDLIEILERQFGKVVWQGKYLLADKVSIAKTIITNIQFDWYGYGSSTSGNKATLQAFGGGAWFSPTFHTANTPTKLSEITVMGSVGYVVQPDGFVYYLANAEASNGTIASVLNTDYAELKLTVNSAIENPNLFRRRNNVVLGDPTNIGGWLDGNTSQTNNIMTQNGTVDQVSTANNGQISQQSFSFDIISLLDRNYDSSIWNGKTLLSDKIAIAKTIIADATFEWWGYGGGAGGNGAYIDGWLDDIKQWHGITQSTGNGTVTKISKLMNTSFPRMIDSNGFINWIAYGKVSDGVTASTISTDYVKLIVTTSITHTIENAHIAKSIGGSGAVSLISPYSTLSAEMIQDSYDRVKSLNGTVFQNATSFNGAYAQQVFSFNAIDILEKQLGVSIWNGKTLLSDKVSIAKQMITSVLPQWYGYGSGAGGNRATFYMWDGTGNSWWGGTISHVANTPQLLQYNYNVQNQIDRIDSNGWYHFLYTTYASDGTTSSILNTDYIKLTLTANTNLTGHKSAVSQDIAIKYPKKNLFNKSLLEIGSIAFSTGNLFNNIKVVSNSRARFSNLIPIKPSTPYIFTVPTGYEMAIQTYTSGSISISDSAWQRQGYIKTTESNAYLACILVKRIDNVPFVLQDIKDIQFQVEEGNVSTSYEIYTTQNKPSYYDPSVITVTSDYVGKISGSVSENPNIAKAWDFTSLITMTQWNTRAEVNQANVDKIKALDANYTTWSWNGSNSIAQHLFSFDIISILERQMGISIWKGATLLSDKIAIAKNIVTNVKTDWYGFGNSVTGNKATVKWWSTGLNVWSTSKVATHSNGTVSLLSLTDNAGLGYVDSNGFMHVTSYAEPSDGVAQSVINTDYIKLTLTVNNPLKQV